MYNNTFFGAQAPIYADSPLVIPGVTTPELDLNKTATNFPEMVTPIPYQPYVDGWVPNLAFPNMVDHFIPDDATLTGNEGFMQEHQNDGLILNPDLEPTLQPEYNPSIPNGQNPPDMPDPGKDTDEEENDKNPIITGGSSSTLLIIAGLAAAYLLLKK